MDKSVLEVLVNRGLSRKKMAAELHVHINTIYKWMLKFGLMTCPLKLCKRCGENRKEKFDIERHTLCRKCRGRRARVNKLLAIEYKGGKCVNCGYDKCPAAMDFHHNDPAEKDHQWRTLRTMSLDKIKKELDKCTLLCKNCHAEVHWERNNANDN